MNIYETMNEKVVYPFCGKSRTYLNKNEDV